MDNTRMISAINDVARIHLEDYHGVVPGECRAVAFDEIAGSSYACITNFNYCLTVGFIKYELYGESRTSDRPILVQSADLRHQLFAYSSLVPSLDIFFVKLVWPQIQSKTVRPTDRLLPESYVSRVGSTETSEKLITIFDFPPGSMVVRNSWLDLAQLQLMAHKIGEFHAYSQMRHSQISNYGLTGSFLRQTYTYLASDLIEAKLRWCLELLRLNLAGVPPELLDDFRSGLDRIRHLLDEFPARLRKAFDPVGAGRCWVLCHQNYSQMSVVFRTQESSQEVRIFNWHSTGFASLGVDLVIMLLVEAAPQSKSRVAFDQLVAVYHEALASTFGNVQVPSVDDIVAQVKVCVPVALYVLAKRVLFFQGEIEGPGVHGSIWTDDLVVEVYKYLITAQLL